MHPEQIVIDLFQYVGCIFQLINMIEPIRVSDDLNTQFRTVFERCMEMAEIFEPHEIEKKSMETIVSELNGRTWPEPTFSVVRRCIHTSADFDYADNLRFSDGAVELGIKLIRSGAKIVTDTKMAYSGIIRRKCLLLHQRSRRGQHSKRQRVHACNRFHGKGIRIGRSNHIRYR